MAAATEEAERQGKPVPSKINVSDRYYRQQRSRPLLLIHVLSGYTKNPDELAKLTKGAPLVAIGLSFPKYEDSSALEVTYKVNLIKARELFSDDAEQGDDEDFQEDEL